MSSQVRQADKKAKNKGFWPLIGFALALSAGVLAWFLKDPVYTWLARTPLIPGFPPAGIDPAQMRLLVAGALFTIMLGIAGLAIAFAAPKRAGRVKETDLIKERKMVIKEKELKKARQRELNRQMKSGK